MLLYRASTSEHNIHCTLSNSSIDNTLKRDQRSEKLEHYLSSENVLECIPIPTRTPIFNSEKSIFHSGNGNKGLD
jgi:hypothetical protein